MWESESFRIAFWPDWSSTNPYQSLFYEALRRHGVDSVSVAHLNSHLIRDQGDRVDAIHFHWAEQVTQGKPDWVRRMRRVKGGWRLSKMLHSWFPRSQFISFHHLLRSFRRNNTRIIWTVHNIEPHEDSSPFTNRIFFALAKHSDLIICHGESARQVCNERWNPHGVVIVMPIGNYDGTYPAPRDRQSVRRELGLSNERPLACCIGNLREYKGIDIACRALEQLGGEVQLLIAGNAINLDTNGLQKWIQERTYARLVLRQLSNQEFADYTEASDVVLLPYRKITGSSALIAALTLGRGVVASDLPFFREILTGHPEAGVLSQPGNPESLAVQLQRYLAVPAQRRNAAARALADTFSWPKVVRPVVDVIQQW